MTLIDFQVNTGPMLGHIRKLKAAAEPAIERGVFEWGERVMARSKEQYVPVDMGILRASGFVMTQHLRDVGPEAQPSGEAEVLARNTAHEIGGVLGFGGPAASYALPMHEGARPHMPPVEPLEEWAIRKGLGEGLGWPIAKKIATVGTTARKYLERPAHEMAGQLDDIVVRSLQRALAAAERTGHG